MPGVSNGINSQGILMKFVCRQCRARYDGEYRESCPGCLAMFSLVRAGLPRAAKLVSTESELVIQREGSFDQLVETKPFEGRRASTGFASIDNVLGRNDFGQYIGQAGISRQGVYLVSGASGLGKTALLYEWLAKFRRDGIRCAFISAEQQANAIRAAIIRIGLDDDLRTMSVMCTKDFGAAMAKVVEADIQIVVVDSLNKISDFEDKTKGDAAKVNLINRMHEDAWRDENKPRAWLVVSQMTKEGDLRGSEELIHDSDATLLLQKGLGDQILIDMPDKNRFGSHGRESARFRMNDRGKMVEILPGSPKTPAAPMLPFASSMTPLNQQSSASVSSQPLAVAQPPAVVQPAASLSAAAPPVSDVLDAEPPTVLPAVPAQIATVALPDTLPPDDSPADGPPFKNETPLVAAARALNDGRAFEGLLATSVRRREARARGQQ